MDLEFNGDGTVNVGMKQYVREVIDDFAEEITKSAKNQLGLTFLQ